MASLVDRVSWRVSNRESIVESRKSLVELVESLRVRCSLMEGPVEISQLERIGKNWKDELKWTPGVEARCALDRNLIRLSGARDY